MVFTHTQLVKLSQQLSLVASRPVHVTPTNFLDYIKNFKLYMKKNDLIRQQLQIFTGSLEKLVTASNDFVNLDVKLKECAKRLQKKVKKRTRNLCFIINIKGLNKINT